MHTKKGKGALAYTHTYEAIAHVQIICGLRGIWKIENYE